MIYVHAGIWRRYFALVIDAFMFTIVYTLWLMILFPRSGLIMTEAFLGVMSYHQFTDCCLQYVMPAIFFLWLYESLFTCSSMQGTLGKALLGIKVTDRKGNRLSFWRACTRAFSKVVITGMLPLGYFLALFTKKKLSLHDLLTGTMVVVSTYALVNKKMNLENELIKMLDEGTINTYDDFLKRKAQLTANIHKRAM